MSQSNQQPYKPVIVKKKVDGNEETCVKMPPELIERLEIALNDFNDLRRKMDNAANDLKEIRRQLAA